MSGAGKFPIQIICQVAGITILASQMDVVSGSYGSIGHASFQTSRALLDRIGIDLVTVSSEQTQVPVNISIQTSDGVMTRVFSGSVLSTEWEFDTDTVTLHARDQAEVFVDQKRILARDAQAVTEALGPLSPGQQLSPSGIATVNRRVSQVVTDIAQQFGFTPVINMGQGTDILAGASFGSSSHTYMTIPQNLWTVLNTLARDTGNEVYTTPDRRLVFGEPGAGLPTLGLTWDIPPPALGSTGFISQSSPVPTVPCARLVVTHNPRRNATFRVLITSYDPVTAKITTGQATHVGSNLAGGSTPLGITSGSAAAQTDRSLLANAQTDAGGTARDLSQVALYTFHWDGLTADDANARAAAIAADIAKRLMHLRCTIDGMPSLLPTQKMTITSPSMSTVFTSNTWYVSGFRHRFRLQRTRSRTWTGLTTDIQALDLPSEALA